MPDQNRSADRGESLFDSFSRASGDDGAAPSRPAPSAPAGGDASSYAPPKAPPALPCSDCRDVMRASYYSLMGRPICAKCRMTYQRKIQRGTGPGAFARASLYGSGAAAAGAALLGVVVLVVGIGRIPMSIGIAIMVARAIGKATDGYGGRRYQLLAVTLTYLAIGLGSLAPVVRAYHSYEKVKAPPRSAQRYGAAGEQAEIADALDGIQKDNALIPGEGEEPLDSATLAARADSIDRADSVKREERAREAFRARSADNAAAAQLAGGVVAALVGAVVLLFTLPLLSLFTFGIYGAAVGILAFGYGMKRAWEMTALSVDWKIEGPFRLGQGPIAPTIGGR